VTIPSIAWPYRIDGRGRSATASGDDHVRQLIEQVLFTAPGERVNRPTFGCGVLQLIFAPNGDVLAAATQLTVQGALQQWLGDVIRVEAVRVESEDSTLRIAVDYVVLRTAERRTSEFVRGAT
jgi:phage baseplate assembly protein W